MTNKKELDEAQKYLEEQQKLVDEREALQDLVNPRERNAPNFGDKARAVEFLSRRLGQNMAGVELKSFQVPQSFLTRLRSSAVPESLAGKYPGQPILVDVTKAADQFGLRSGQIRELQEAIVQGTGKSVR